MSIVHGEYWSTPESLIYCDGDADVSIPNHAMVVKLHLMQGILEELDQSRWEPFVERWDDQEALMDGIAFMEDLHDFLDQSPNFDPFEKRNTVDLLVADTGIYFYDIQLALDCSFDGDHTDRLRQYATEFLGWIRIQDENIQLHGMDCAKVDRLADHLYEAFDEQVCREEFFIEDTKSGECYEKVPYADLCDGPIKVRRHLRRTPC